MSKFSTSAVLPRPVTKIICSIPASRASSTAYWISGVSTIGSSSLGIALVAGRKRVPSPATGNTALRIGFRLLITTGQYEAWRHAVNGATRTFAGLRALAARRERMVTSCCSKQLPSACSVMSATNITKNRSSRALPPSPTGSRPAETDAGPATPGPKPWPTSRAANGRRPTRQATKASRQRPAGHVLSDHSPALAEAGREP